MTSQYNIKSSFDLAIGEAEGVLVESDREVDTEQILVESQSSGNEGQAVLCESCSSHGEQEPPAAKRARNYNKRCSESLTFLCKHVCKAAH